MRGRLGLEKSERVDGREVDDERGDGVAESNDGDSKGNVEG